jgi:hypothetical protein
MPDVMEISARDRNRMRHHIDRLVAYRKERQMRWLFVCDLFLLHKDGF